MRIISGRLGGRQFRSPSGHKTHPMSDKIRGAVFNMLGDIEGLSVLDAFSGSGAIAFEALSRGGGRTVAIDNDKNAQRALKENAKDLQLEDKVKIINANVGGWSDNNPGEKFDLVFCDPPYDKLQLGVIGKLVRHVSDSGLLILSYPGSADTPVFESLKAVEIKNYGDAQLIFYEKDV